MRKLLAKALGARPVRSGEGRQAVRYEVEEPLEFHAWPVKDGQDKVLGYGRLLDLSETGVRFTYSGRIKVGQTVRLRSLEMEGSLLQADPTVTVRWTADGPEDEKLAGAEFCSTLARRFGPFRAD